MCGEHRSGFNALFFLTGSSPHVRGARKDSPLRRCHSGIIPACAGSTLTLAVSRSRARDHPRMCGEHPIQGKPARVGTGSSPHVRGALAQRHGTIVASGIIPACAGSTRVSRGAATRCRDHPRMCGEHTDPDGDHAMQQGSSPHVRGARVADPYRLRVAGIIPACAGSTFRPCFRAFLFGDHPRMCGEHDIAACVHFRKRGSSPHVRGAPGTRRIPENEGGIIPACAGSTPA